MSDFAAIIAAAGRSSRFGDASTKKVFVEIDGRPLWSFSAQRFRETDAKQILLVTASEDRQLVESRYGPLLESLDIQLVEGGAERADSVLNGLAAVSPNIPLVAVHDAARPCVSMDAIKRVCQEARTTRAAILAIPCPATIKRSGEQRWIQETVPRTDIWLAQTPQVFDKDLLRESFAKHPNPSLATDEAAIVEAAGHPVKLVQDESSNLKVTTQPDMRFVRAFLSLNPPA